MQKFFLIAILIGAACADDDAHAHVAHDHRKVDKHGHFEYGYDITNGIGADESGDEHEVHGEYHYTSKDGVPVKVSYTADEHGYHPHGDLLPTPPPTPEAILKALKYIETHPNNNHHDGHYTEHNHDVHNTHHDAHNTHHDAHNTHHDAHNTHHNAHHDTRHNAHHDTHHSAHHDNHHNAHHDNHRNVHHDSHHDNHRNVHHDTHHDNHHNAHGSHHDGHHSTHH